MDFYQTLNYSLGNEDWICERQALKVTPDATVLCVTASGDRPLHLMMTNCKSVISLDMNHIQNFLLELKLAAIRQFDYEKYLAFLGGKPSENRTACLTELKPLLSKDAYHYWLKHPKQIKKGIIYQGAVERLTKLSSLLFQFLFGSRIKQLFAFENLDKQKIFIKEKWDKLVLRKIFEYALNPNIIPHLIRDPGLTAHLDQSIQPGKYIYSRMLNYLENHLANESPLLQLVLTGKIIHFNYYPYLTEQGFNQIKASQTKIFYETTNIIEWLHRKNDIRIDAFSLSDIASYMPQEMFEKLLRGVYAKASEKARFCLREFMSKRFIPETLKSCFIRDSALENKLSEQESHFIYRFMVGDVCKSF